MKLFQQIKYWSLFVLVALSLNACENNDDFEDDYGDGSPQASNIIIRKGYQYEYNSNGLITVINRIQTKTDEQGNTSNELYTVARISYPQSNRAVMETTEFGNTTYVFAFGTNNFAHRIIQTDSDGESYLIKLSYDNDGHLTGMDDSGDVLEMRYTNGNLSYVKGNDDDENASAEITYGTDTNFDTYNMSPFLLDINLGPFMSNLDWWFDTELSHALYAGFLGKPFAKNLPTQVISHDNANGTTNYDFEYFLSDDGEGRYSQNERYE